MEKTYAKDQEMRVYFCQLMLDKEASVASHPGYQAAEMKGVWVESFVRRENGESGWKPVDGAAVAMDAASAESKMEASIS